jgi:hypothetical protein
LGVGCPWLQPWRGSQHHPHHPEPTGQTPNPAPAVKKNPPSLHPLRGLRSVGSRRALRCFLCVLVSESGSVLGRVMRTVPGVCACRVVACDLVPPCVLRVVPVPRCCRLRFLPPDRSCATPRRGPNGIPQGWREEGGVGGRCVVGGVLGGVGGWVVCGFWCAYSRSGSLVR